MHADYKVDTVALSRKVERRYELLQMLLLERLLGRVAEKAQLGLTEPRRR